MATSSELSRILNNVNGAVYPSELLPQQPMLHTVTFPTSGINKTAQLTDLSSGHMLGSWQQVHPMFWTKKNVMDWIEYHVEDSKYDASLLNMDYCFIDGASLCQQTHEAFLSMYGDLGERLYQNLDRLRLKHEMPCDLSDPLNETYTLLTDFLGNLPQIPPFLNEDGFGLLDTVVVGSADIKKERDSYDSCSYFPGFSSDMTPLSDGYESGSSLSDSHHSSTMGSFMNPSSPESTGSESDPEYMEKKFNINKSFVKQERGVQKRGRGRPPKTNRGSDHYLETKKSKHAPRGTHLWEFIRDILIHPEKNQGLMKWEDRRDGVFKFLKSEAVAQLWGQKKKNSSMTYEKLSRAMRYYYKREILERVDGRRLVYKFGKNASGWKLEEVGLGM
ncbi:ETS-related transcription factor Elf-3 isoform X1 [Sardina pilchardus]|uniref:ETS-related transcription factor Elf-3 isoform X1 n=1 Tax=Sardina pilchardus TaxID=27697 RepID=UPI002E168468